MTFDPFESALAFDLDDTLFDHRAAMARLLAELGLPNPEVAELLEFDRRGKRPRELFCDAVSRKCALSADEVWSTIVARLAANAELIAPHVVAEAASRFELALLTNGGSANQRNKVAALGLERWIPRDRWLISAEIGVAKPHRRAFAALLDVLGRGGESVVYVGDDPVADIAGARAAGLRTCWVARGRAFPDTPLPDWTIDSIAELPTVWHEFPT